MLTVAHPTCSHLRARPATHRTHIRRSILLLADELSVAAAAATHAGERGCKAAARDIEVDGRRRAEACKLDACSLLPACWSAPSRAACFRLAAIIAPVLAGHARGAADARNGSRALTCTDLAI